MAKSPIVNFREDDFPEVKEPWIQKLLPKLNDLARQVANALTSRLTITDNFSGFWWEGNVGNYKTVTTIIFPFTQTTVTAVTNKGISCINAFPFNIQIPPGSGVTSVGGIVVAQASDITVGSLKSEPALLAGVAWTQNGNTIVISAINGMLTGRAYSIRLLVLGA